MAQADGLESDAAQACLRDLAGGALVAVERTKPGGHRRWAYTRRGAGDHISAVLQQLAALELVEMNANFDAFVLSAKGRALMGGQEKGAA